MGGGLGEGFAWLVGLAVRQWWGCGGTVVGLWWDCGGQQFLTGGLFVRIPRHYAAVVLY